MSIETWDPRWGDLTFRSHYADGAMTGIELMTPWCGFVLISDQLLKESEAPYLVVQDTQPQRVRFELMNGWAVYEFMERDDFRELSAWKCVECWGGPTPEEAPVPCR